MTIIHPSYGGVNTSLQALLLPTIKHKQVKEMEYPMSLASDLKLTPSRVRDYLACPLQFGRLYGPAAEYQSSHPKAGSPGQEDTASKARTAALAFGNCLHAALETLHRPAPTELLGLNEPYPPQDVALSDEELSRVMAQHWRPEGYEDKQAEEAAFTQACALLRFYTRSEHTPKGQVLATEAYLTALTTLRGYRVEISCRADRLELHSDGTLEVLDYKLTRNGELPSGRALSEDLSSFLYWLLAWHHYKKDSRVRNVRISQLALLTLAKVEVEYDQHQVIRHREALAELVTCVMESPLEPRINAGCAWCPVQQSCPAWADLDMADLDSFEAWSLR
jgi:RecB family exonuclease